jgi:hypothetical protein
LVYCAASFMSPLYALRRIVQHLFYALRILFFRLLFPMTWQDCLDLGPTRLSRLLGCPVTTAHSWIRRSGPPDWQQVIFAAFIIRKIKAEQNEAGKA